MAMALRRVAPALAVLSCVLTQDPVVAGDLAAATPWSGPLHAVDAALARRDLATAVDEWHHARVAALRSRKWQGLAEVGDAYVRMVAAGAFSAPAKPLARSLYLEALVWAKSQRSAEGALRMAAAFDRLGDRGVVEQCVKVAANAARRQRDVAALHQVAEARERLVLQAATPFAPALTDAGP
jgi:hypothetical protein